MKIRKNEIWSAYQKEIADDRYYFARSCIRQNIFPAAENLYLNILRNDLGKDIYDDIRQTTCTGIAYHSGTDTYGNNNDRGGAPVCFNESSRL
jgi:heterodisulfide reductase subunit B